jgi:preprotein translocase subunit Sec61beta
MSDKHSFKKIKVAPQIVIYQNLLKNSNKLIEKIEVSNNKLWPQWKPWYEQGKNINQLFYRDQVLIKNQDSDDLKKEKEYLSYIMDVYDFVKNDYLSEYSKNNGIWPDYIKQWDKVWQKLDPVHINIYKYDAEHFNKTKSDGLMLEYHVDEMPEESHERMWHQVVTITFYLNDDYEGGEICFYDESENKAYKYKPRAGDVTVFPSGAPFYHGVENFSGSDRYFMRIFIPYSSEGDKEWLKKNVVYDEAYIKEQEKKLDEFVSKYTHAVTLQFPDQKVDKVHGKLVQLDQEIIIVE